MSLATFLFNPIEKKRYILSALLLGCGLFSYSENASANCWTYSSLDFNFGNIPMGQSASTQFSVNIECQGEYGKDLYHRVCVSMKDSDPPFKMSSWQGSNLYYTLYAGPDRRQELGLLANNKSYNFVTTTKSELNSSDYIVLSGTVAPGQTGLLAENYEDHSQKLLLTFASSTDLNDIPNCLAGNSNNVEMAIDTKATIENACFLQDVSEMNFGEVSGVNGKISALANSRIAIQCPANTQFQVALDHGLNRQGSTRRMCSASSGDCINYELYQDSAMSKEWGPDASNSLSSSSNAAGNVTNLTVYGKVPQQPLPSAGDYMDSVIVILTY